MNDERKDVVSAEIKLYVKEFSDKTRNQTLGIFAFIAIIFSLFAGLGVYGIAVNHINKEIAKNFSTGIGKKSEELAQERSNQIEKIQENAEKLFKKIRTHEEQLSNLKPKDCYWIKWFNDERKSCKDGYVVVGANWGSKNKDGEIKCCQLLSE